MGYNLMGRETVKGALFDKCFGNHIKNKCEKLINMAEIYGLHFKGDGATIKETPSLIFYLGGFTYLCQSKILWNVQVTSLVVTIRMLNVLRRVSLIQGMTMIQRRNLGIYICSMEPMCALRQEKIEVCISYSVTYFGIKAYLP